MKLPILAMIAAALALVGCAHKDRRPFTAPAMTKVSGPLKQAGVAIKESQKKAQTLKTHVDTAGLPIWQELTGQLEEANRAAAQASASLVLVEADVKTLTEEANREAALRQAAEAKLEATRAQLLHVGRRGDLLIVIIAAGLGILGTAELMPYLRKAMLPVAATGWGSAILLLSPFLLPAALGFAAFWAIRWALEFALAILAL